MKMKWVFATLLLCNVGLYLWTYGQRPASTEFIRPPVNGETMMLLSEIAPVKSETPDEIADGQPAEQPYCLRIGPFFDIAQASESGDRLSKLSIPFEARSVKAREIRAYRVFLGPFPSTEAVQEQRAVLNENDITDHYVKKQSGEEDIISLGLFTQSDGADSLVSQLKAKDITAQIRIEDRLLNSTYWLELRDSQANRKSQSELSVIDWGDERTRVSEFPCS